MRRKKFFETSRQAKQFKKSFNFVDMNAIKIYDLRKSFSRRKKTRFFLGTYFEWLNI